MDIANNKASITIVNTLGQNLIEQIFEGTELRIDVKSLPPGMYYYRIKRQGVIISVGKFIKR